MASLSGDHPREYGENVVLVLVLLVVVGSSPRIRGESLKEHGLKICIRIIPANTGRIKALCNA